MAERYERDEYSFEEYSNESINIGCVSSWSINDIAQHRPVIDVRLEQVHFNSDVTRISDEKLYRLADRLQQAGTGDPMAQIARGRRAVRASLRDYEQEALWASRLSGPPRRIGERIEKEPVPHERAFCLLVRRMVLHQSPL